MKGVINQLQILQKQFDEKSQKRYGMQNLVNLAKKLDEESDDFVMTRMTTLIDELKKIRSDNSKKAYFNVYKDLKKYVKETYGYVPKGSVQEAYLTFGIAIGLLIGIAFIAVNTALLAVGLSIGVALGLSLGASKEKELEKENKLY